METAAFVNPSMVVAILAVVLVAVRTWVDIRTLNTVPARKEHITRAEYDKDEKARKERLRALAVKCRLNAKRLVAERTRVDGKFEMLMNLIGELKVQMTRVETLLERAEVNQRVHVVSARPLAVPANETNEPPQGAA